MFVYNVEKLNPDGFKQEATDITHARLYYNDFAGNNYVQGVFVDGSTSTVEFDETGIGYYLFKMFTSIDGVNYIERPSFGGTNGTTLTGAGMILDPEDYTESLPYVKMQVVDGVKRFVPGAGGSGVTVGTGVDYLFVRGRLIQENTIRSGKAFFGGIAVNGDTGAYEFPNTLTPELTIADSWSLSRSEKISTGIYALQFQTDAADQFVDAIANPAGRSYVFEQTTYEVWRKLTPTYNAETEQYQAILTNEFVGTLVLCIDTESSGSLSHTFSSGAIHVKTYDPDGVLADNIITAGVTIEFKAYPSL